MFHCIRSAACVHVTHHINHYIKMERIVNGSCHLYVSHYERITDIQYVLYSNGYRIVLTGTQLNL